MNRKTLSVALAFMPVLVVIGLKLVASPDVVIVREARDAWPMGTFHTGNLVVDDNATIGSVTNPNSLTLNGGWTNAVTVTNSMSEVMTQFLTGSGHTTAAGDVFGLVVRNAVTFNTVGGSNQAGAIYGEVTSSVDTGGNMINLYAVRANAVCGGAGVASDCYGFFADHGRIRVDDGALFGPTGITGTLGQTAGNVHLNQTSGTTTIDGTTHIANIGSTALLVDGGGEFGAAVTFDANIRVNGNANLDGSPTSFVFMHKIDTSGAPLEISNSTAIVAERITGPGAALPAIGNTVITGSGTAVTLADGTKDGEVKNFTIPSGTGSITPAHGTAYSWSAAPAGITLMWDATGVVWRQISGSGTLAGSSNVIISPSGPPTADHGTVTTGSTNFIGDVTGIGANTSVVLTYTAAFPTRSRCIATPLNATVTVEQIIATTSASGVTFSCIAVTTGSAANCDDFTYQCVGQ